MFEVYFVTNRKLCEEDFLLRVERLADAHPKGIILREKDLSAAEYASLAKKVMRICEKQGVMCVLHTFYGVARELGAPCLQLPMPFLRELAKEERTFHWLGASCHSAAEAQEAESAGCTHVTAGHIFPTGCKESPPRGLSFLKEVVESVRVPVLAIGGIGKENFPTLREAGAAGACLMSGAMTCADPSFYTR